MLYKKGSGIILKLDVEFIKNSILGSMRRCLSVLFFAVEKTPEYKNNFCRKKEKSSGQNKTKKVDYLCLTKSDYFSFLDGFPGGLSGLYKA